MNTHITISYIDYVHEFTYLQTTRDLKFIIFSDIFCLKISLNYLIIMILSDNHLGNFPLSDKDEHVIEEFHDLHLCMSEKKSHFKVLKYRSFLFLINFNISCKFILMEMDQ